MLKSFIRTSVFLSATFAATAFAGSSFQQTCSNIGFAYTNNQATLQAVCLRANGTSNPTSLVLAGISNQNGTLTQGSGASSFQQSCGNIQIIANNPQQVTLSAFCRTASGSSNPTSLQLNNISNNNGVLQQ